MSEEKKYMTMVLELAKKGEGKTYPNPLVGCVIVKDGKVVSAAYYEKSGKSHAERKAIEVYKKETGNRPVGCDLYVNLEPCSNYGRIPPCAEVIIENKIRRVFIGMRDPNPLVNGRGISQLKDAGIKVVENVLTDECEHLNRVFMKNIKMKSAYFSLKIATTLDGYMADKLGTSRWITNESSRKRVHHLRERCDALLVGIGTVLSDNPSLNIRRNDDEKTNQIIVLDRNFKISREAKLFKCNGFKNVWIITTQMAISKNFVKYENLTNLGAHVIVLSLENGRFAKNLGEKLNKFGFCNVLVEAGPGVTSRLLELNMADELHHFIAPKLIGASYEHKHFVSNLKIKQLSEAKNLKINNTELIDGDLYIQSTF